MEVDRVDVGGCERRAGVLENGRAGLGLRLAPLEADAAAEVDRLLRLGLPREDAASDEAALRLDGVARGAEDRLHADGAGLVAIELERREEVDVLDRGHPEAGHESRRGLREGLDPHDAREDRGAVDAVVEEERLGLRVEVRLDDEAAVEEEGRKSACHRPGGKDGGGGRVEAAGLVPLPREDAEAQALDDLARERGGDELAPDDRDARSRRKEVDAGQLHHLRDRAAGRHAHVAPGGPVESEAAGAGPGRPEARGELAEEVVGRAVVGLAAVAEAARDRAEGHRRADRRVAERREEVEEPVGLDVEDEVELGGLLVREEAADLEPGPVEEDVDARAPRLHVRDDLRHARRVAQVAGVPVDGAARRLDGADRGERRGEPLDAGQLLLDEGGRGPLPLRLQPLEDVLLQAVAVGRDAPEVGVAPVGLGEEVEEVERAA